MLLWRKLGKASGDARRAGDEARYRFLVDMLREVAALQTKDSPH